MDVSYSIGELARRAGTTARTIRYYVAEGLLPAPDTRGRYARYTDAHLNRLLLIARLKESYLPLGAIKARLDKRSDADVQRLISSGEITRQADEPVDVDQAEERLPMLSLPLTPAGDEKALPYAGAPRSEQDDRQRPAVHRPFQFGYAAVRQQRDPPPSQTVAETWQRMLIAPGVELHVRTPDSADLHARIAQLQEYAWERFGDDS